MSSESNTPYIINSISDQHRLLSLPKPGNPLVSVFNFADVKENKELESKPFVLNFYCVAIKKGFTRKLKYGQHFYDFDEGVMSFISPGQLLSLPPEDESPATGACLIVHPQFLAGYPLARVIKKYGFFSYALHEALHLSEKEEEIITGIMQHINDECRAPIDGYSQDVIIAHIELLLNYSNRFYNRQFITRKAANNDILLRVESILADYFEGDKVKEFGLPTVQFLSNSLNVSSNYLSDMLRMQTGKNTQQHIHDQLIEKAKEILSTTSLSVSEVAYALGFEYPQSFNKLFKKRTSLSPLAFRQSFN